LFQGLFDTLIDFDGDLYRNIPSLRVSEDLLDDLSDDPKERRYGEAAAESQVQNNEGFSPIITRPFRYGVALTDAPYGRPVTRFSDGSRFGVWYGSLDLITTVHETVYHFKRRVRSMLAEINEEVVSERRVFLVYAKGLLVDLRDKQKKFPGLIDKNSYAFTHTVGAYLFDQGQNGLLVMSARHDKGTNAAIFEPDILSNPRHQCYLSYRWQPDSERVKIERRAGRTWRVI
jgi:hypothetical protein